MGRGEVAKLVGVGMPLSMIMYVPIGLERRPADANYCCPVDAQRQAEGSRRSPRQI